MLKNRYICFFFILFTLLFHPLSYADIPPSKPVIEFQRTWVAQALKLQREMDLNAPLNQATFIGTHNSYNSKAYQIPVLRYNDPNQLVSMGDQLELGARSVELDVHWTLGQKFKKELLLCHGYNNHVGCGQYDRPFKIGLWEIKDFLDANPKEVLLLYIEPHVDGHDKELFDTLNSELGSYIFTSDHSFDALIKKKPITKADILRAGKQVIVIMKQCDTNVHHTQEINFIEAILNKFRNGEDCGEDTAFSVDRNHEFLWHVYEDRTIWASIVHPTKKIDTRAMRQLTKCGINWLALDQLKIDDPRFYAAIWSWAPGFPRENDDHCTIYKVGEGIENISCQQRRTHFACQQEQTSAFKIISAEGQWLNGEAYCQALAGETWHFAVPVNGKQMAQLKNQITSEKEIWLNYAYRDGTWKTNLK